LELLIAAGYLWQESASIYEARIERRNPVDGYPMDENTHTAPQKERRGWNLVPPLE
jgi:hypothetical protein